MPARKSVFQIHLWAGLTAGLFLGLMGLTGAILMFRPELDARWNADLLRVAPAPQREPLDMIVDAAGRAHPAGRIDLVRIFSDPGASVQVEFTDNAAAFVDPHTAAVLGVGHKYSAFFFWVEQLHRYLALGPSGAVLTGTFALACAVLIVTGAYLWLPPAWRAVKGGLLLNRRFKGRAWHFNLHKVVGAYAGAFALFSAMTGAPDALEWVKNLEYAVTRSAPPKAPRSVMPAGLHSARISWESRLRAVQTLDPTAHEIVIHDPEGPRSPVNAFFVDAAAPQPDARSVVYLDAYSGAVLAQIPYVASSRGYRLYFWGLALHQGLAGGWLWRCALLVGALALPLLAFTGGMMYYRRKFRVAARQPQTASSSFLTWTPPKKHLN